MKRRPIPVRGAALLVVAGLSGGIVLATLMDWSQWPSFRTTLAAAMIAGFVIIAATGALGLMKARS